MAKIATSLKQLRTSAGKLQTLKAVIANDEAQAALGAGNFHFIFPKMSGAAAAELMKAAGILTPTGKLTKAYR